MNKNQVKGEAKDIAEKPVGSKEQQAKGLKKQAEGKIQKGAGNVEEAVADAEKSVKKG